MQDAEADIVVRLDALETLRDRVPQRFEIHSEHSSFDFYRRLNVVEALRILLL